MTARSIQIFSNDDGEPCCVIAWGSEPLSTLTCQSATEMMADHLGVTVEEMGEPCGPRVWWLRAVSAEETPHDCEEYFIHCPADHPDARPAFGFFW